MKSKSVKKREVIMNKPKHTSRELTHAFPIVVHEDGEEVIVGGVSRLEYITAMVYSAGRYVAISDCVGIAKEIIKQCKED